MRTKPLEATYYIPNKLIKSLSTTLPSNFSTTESGEKRFETRIEKGVQIRIENDVPKHGTTAFLSTLWRSGFPLAGSLYECFSLLRSIILTFVKSFKDEMSFFASQLFIHTN